MTAASRVSFIDERWFRSDARARASSGWGSVPSGRARYEDPTEHFVRIASVFARSISRKPLLAMTAALAVGFVIGGGMSTRAGRLALGAAGRHVIRELLRNAI
jgi:hypothetical protein